MLGGLNFVDLMNRGGALMWVLLAFSFVALAVTVERILTYASYGYSPDRWLRSLLQTIRTSGSAAALCPPGRENDTMFDSRRYMSSTSSSV